MPKSLVHKFVLFAHIESTIDNYCAGANICVVARQSPSGYFAQIILRMTLNCKTVLHLFESTWQPSHEEGFCRNEIRYCNTTSFYSFAPLQSPLNSSPHTSTPTHSLIHSQSHLLLDVFPSNTFLSGITCFKTLPLLQRSNFSCSHTILPSALLKYEPDLSLPFPYDLRFFIRFYQISEHCGLVVTTPVLYSGSPAFKSRPGLTRLRRFVVFLSHYRHSSSN